MTTWAKTWRVDGDAAKRFLTALGIALLGAGAALASWRSSPPSLQTLDPSLMKAVTAAVSPHDVKAILMYQHSDAPVSLRLFSSCVDGQRCTIFATMNFYPSELPALPVSLHVAVQIDAAAGSAIAGSSWRVQTIDTASNKHATYAGDFNNLHGVPAIGANGAVTGLLVSIHCAIRTVLAAKGMIALAAAEAPFRAHATCAVVQEISAPELSGFGPARRTVLPETLFLPPDSTLPISPAWCRGASA